LPDEAREECDEAVTEQDAPLRVLGRRVTGVRRDLDGGDGFDGFAARDGEDPRLVRARCAAGALGAVEACSFGGSDGLAQKAGPVTPPARQGA
jgi:hypothetical protein